MTEKEMAELIAQVRRELLGDMIALARRSEKSRVQKPVAWGSLADFMEAVRDGKAFEEEPAAVSYFRPPIIPPEFPKLKVKYGKTGAALEWIIVNNGDEENPYREWSSEKMPMREDLIARGIPARPAEEWQRRKQFTEKGRE